MGAPPFFVFDQLYITFLIFFFSVSVKLKLSRAFNSSGRANLGRRLSLRWLCLDEMFHDRFRAKRRRYFLGGYRLWKLSAPFLRRSDLRGVCNGFIAALGLGAHAFVAGGGTFVASALLASPSVQVC